MRFFDLEQLDQLAGVWDQLAAMQASPMRQYIWARACAEAFDDRLQTEAMAEMGAVLCLGRLPADSPVIAALRKAYRLRG